MVGSSWVLMLSVGCLLCDHRPLFIDLSLKLVLVTYIFVFPLVHFSFSLSVFLGLCFVLATKIESLMVLVAFSLIYFKKTKLIALLHTHLHFAFAKVSTCISLFGVILVLRISFREYCIFIRKEKELL